VSRRLNIILKHRTSSGSSCTYKGIRYDSNNWSSWKSVERFPVTDDLLNPAGWGALMAHLDEARRRGGWSGEYALFYRGSRIVTLDHTYSSASYVAGLRVSLAGAMAKRVECPDCGKHLGWAEGGYLKGDEVQHKQCRNCTTRVNTRVAGASKGMTCQ
jgi:hypothetical protein